MIDENLLYDCVRRLMKRGGKFADIFYESREATYIDFDNNIIEKAQSGYKEGIGIRLINTKNKTAFAYCNNLSEKEINKLIDNIINISNNSDKDVVIEFTNKEPHLIYKIQKPVSEIPLEVKTAMLIEGNNIARSLDNSIIQVKAIYSDLLQKVKIVTSEGIVVEDNRSYITALVETIATDGKELQSSIESIGGMTGFEIFDDTPFAEICEASAKRALMMIKAPKMKGGRMPVVISSTAGGTMIHEAVGHGLEADLAMEGLSVYSNRIGEKIASDNVTVIDDGTLTGKRGTYCFDDEGNYSQRNILIDKGILKCYLSDKLSSLKYNIPITGNGRRQSFESQPIPRMSNTFLLSGHDNPEDIIKNTHHGIFVKKMGGGQVNTVTGEFVFEVQEGYIIENGSVGSPVRAVTLIGNGHEVLKNIDKIGTDLGFSIGTCGKNGQGVPVSDALPTIRIAEMVVGGKVE